LTTIQLQERAHREGKVTCRLLPNLRLPLNLPVWREASYQTGADLTLPAYHAEAKKDSALALHLARYGDHEGALKLLEPGDTEGLKRIEGQRLERNYPLEWSRLAALVLHAAQLRLAEGESEGLIHLVNLHSQLLKTLDARAA